jgi:hypothetical protein
MTSPNGINWTSRADSANHAWHCVTYGTPGSSGLFVALSVTGNRDIVMTSPDGINWTSGFSPVNNHWRSVVFANGLFVAVSITGTGDRVMTSPDGITWTSRTSASDNDWTGVTYGNGLFVSVSSSGIGNRVMTSHDGINWTSRTSASDNNWTGVTYGNGLFVSISSSGTGDRVMTGVDNSCFLKGSLILTETNEYIPIEQLKKGDLIKTYKNGDKKIHYVGKKLFSNSTSNTLFSMYRNETNNLTLAGGHSILVDKLTEEQEKQQNSILFYNKIEDKYLLLCCYSELFKKIDITNETLEIYHLCLENDDLNGHYGIWANNILTETCSINHFKNMNFQLNSE